MGVRETACPEFKRCLYCRRKKIPFYLTKGKKEYGGWTEKDDVKPVKSTSKIRTGVHTL